MYFYSDAELDMAWQAAASPNESSDYREAVTVLARRRTELDAPVFVYIDGPLSGATWREVTANSKALCRCGRRRMIVPNTGRTLLQPTSDSLVLGVNKMLVILPWGGDWESAYLSFRCDPVYGLVGIANPYVQQESDSGMPGILIPKGGHQQESAFPMDELAEIVSAYGGNLCMWKVGGFNFPLAMVESVDAASCTISFVPDQKVQQLDLTVARRRHVCTGS